MEVTVVHAVAALLGREQSAKTIAITAFLQNEFLKMKASRLIKLPLRPFVEPFSCLILPPPMRVVHFAKRKGRPTGFRRRDGLRVLRSAY